MSKLYGKIDGDMSRTDIARRGNKELTATAATWSGCVRAEVTSQKRTNQPAGRPVDSDGFSVRLDKWGGAGVDSMLARGEWRGGQVVLGNGALWAALKLLAEIADDKHGIESAKRLAKDELHNAHRCGLVIGGCDA
ncbi:MAG: hypothetical protein HN420_16935 [Rhodospirillaceae bacterium]|jgi:hypothetical protein|nr:hypothetical protein [Rhodospirillaceae bacterium]